MGYSNIQMLKMLRNSKAGFANSLKNETVLADVAYYGFPKEKLEYGLELNKKAEDMFMDKGIKSSRKMSLNHSWLKKYEACLETFFNYRKIFRRAFVNEPELIFELELNTDVPGTYMGRITKMKEFYQIPRDKANILEKVSVNGLPTERIDSEMTEITEIETEFLDKDQVKMEYEKSTFDRENVFKELGQLWGHYRELLMVLYLKKDPQFLEAYGIQVPTEGFYNRKKKKKQDPEDDTIPPEVDELDETDESDEDEDFSIEKCIDILEKEAEKKD